MSLLYSSTAIAYVNLTSISLQLGKLKNFGQPCRYHFRSSHFCTYQSETRRTGHAQFFPIHSWADPPHTCVNSAWLPFHFRDCQIYFCLPLTSSIFGL